MKNNSFLWTTASALVMLGSLPACGGTLTILPARVLAPSEATALPGTAGVTTLPVILKTAAYVNTALLGNPQPAMVARGAGTNSAVYSGFDGVGGPPPPQTPQLAPPVPLGSEHYNFKQSADAVQGWATMTSSGQPYLYLGGFGQFSADGHASWRTNLTLPSGLHRVYLKVTVPAITVFGNYEQNAPALYRARARADVLVNGHSVYFGEAVRINESDAIPSSSTGCNFTSQETKVHLLTYGQPLGFSGPADTDPTTEQLPSQPQTVTLYLGSFDSTESLDVQFVLNAEATSQNRCCQKPTVMGVPGEIFCSASSTSFDFQNSSPVFYVQ